MTYFFCSEKYMEIVTFQIYSYDSFCCKTSSTLTLPIYHQMIPNLLTLKEPITTAADDKFCEIFPKFRKNKVYFMRIVCQQTILMKYHAFFVIF